MSLLGEISDRFEVANTAILWIDAARNMLEKEPTPQLKVDDGVENINEDVDPFYVEEHNSRSSHSAFDEQTPEEM